MAEQAKQPEAEKPEKAEKAEKPPKGEKPSAGEAESSWRLTAGEKAPEKAAKKKIRRSVSRGIVYVKATFNNTLVTVTDTNGDTLVRESAGTTGFKGSRKSTPFAAQRRRGAGRDEGPKDGPERSRSAGQGPRQRAEDAITRAPGGGPEDYFNRGHHADAAQRLPSAEEAKSVVM